MPRVLLIATTTGYQTRAFGDAAERLGVDLVYATDRCHVLDDPWQDRAIPIRFSRRRRVGRAIVDAVRARPIDGVLAVGDRPTVMAARAARRSDCRGIRRWRAGVAATSSVTRERLRDAGLPVPWFLPVHLSSDVLDAPAIDHLPVRRQAAGAVGQPRRDAGRR